MDGPLLVLGNIVEVDDALGGGLKLDVLPSGEVWEKCLLHHKDSNNPGIQLGLF